MKYPNRKLGDVAEIIAGQSPPSNFYNKDNSGLPFYQGKSDFSEKFPVARSWTTSKKHKEAIANDILLSVRAPVGPVNLCQSTSVIGRGLAAIRPKTGNHFEYFYYFLKNNEQEIAKHSTGSTFKAITQTQIAKIQIPLPPLPEQVAIANLLSKAEALIAKRKESLALLDAYLKSTFVDRFVNKNYPLEKLVNLTTKITDGEHKKPDYTESGLPFISVVNISKGFLNFENCKFVSLEDHVKFNRRCNPEIGDILYTKVGATYGRAVLVDVNKPFSLYVSVALIKPDISKINPRFLNSAINHPFVKRQADKSIKGAGVPDLHLIEIKNFQIPVPPLELQNQFAGIVEKVEALKEKYQKSLGELEKLYGSLSQRAFRGELGKES